METLASIATLYLGYDKRFSDWKIPIIPHNSFSGFMRPDDADIGDGINELTAFFNELMRLPSHADMAGDNDLTAANFRMGEDSHMLFRPSLRWHLPKRAQSETSLRNSFGGFHEQIDPPRRAWSIKIEMPMAPWCGVIWNAIGKGEMRKGSGMQKLCMHLFVYLLGGNLDDPTLCQLLNTTLNQ